MNVLPPTPQRNAGQAHIVQTLAKAGYGVFPVALDSAITETLYAHQLQLTEHDYTPAGVGRGNAYHQNEQIRRDTIHWLDRSTEKTRGYWKWIESLRLGINQELFLGLFEYEAHFARYAPGAFYKKHVDAFKGKSSRVVTTVLYLNQNWKPEDGGELLIYDETGSDVIETVLPEFGTLVVFLSERFPHEVKPATRERVSIAGWFRVNSNIV